MRVVSVPRRDSRSPPFRTVCLCRLRSGVFVIFLAELAVNRAGWYPRLFCAAWDSFEGGRFLSTFLKEKARRDLAGIGVHDALFRFYGFLPNWLLLSPASPLSCRLPYDLSSSGKARSSLKISRGVRFAIGRHLNSRPSVPSSFVVMVLAPYPLGSGQQRAGSRCRRTAAPRPRWTG